MTLPRVGITWSRREPPLTPVAVVADTSTCSVAGTVRTLAQATVERLAAGADLRVVEGDGWIVVIGLADDLPWVDGATYLGWDSGLLVRTSLQPSVPAALLRAALPPADLVVALPDHVLLAPLPLRAADALRVGRGNG